jgi:hypothetical protein
MASNAAATQEKKLSFKPRTMSKTDHPDAPDGGWDAIIPKGRSKASVSTDEEKNPVANIVFKLLKADEEENESHQGSEISQRFTWYDIEGYPNRKKADNMNRGRIRGMCEAVELEFDEVYPEEVKTMKDIEDFIEAFEGKKLKIYTRTRTYESNGEQRNQTEVLFRDPNARVGGTAQTDDDNEDRPAARKGKGRR